jgi:WD40 repeat protein
MTAFYKQMPYVFVLIALTSVFPAPASADVLVNSPFDASVKRYDDAGNYVADFIASGTAGISVPSGLAIGPDNNLYVSDGPSNRVLRFDGKTGAFIDVFAEHSQLFGPTDLEFRGDDLFVGMWNQSTLQGGVARFDSVTGTFEQSFGVGFGRTHAIEFDANGNIFASHFDIASIDVYNPQTGALINQIAGVNTVGLPMGISFNTNGKLIVSDWNGSVRIVDPITETLDQILISGLNNTQWHQIAPDGSLIVDDYGNGRLLSYDPVSGAFIGEFTNLGYSPEKFLFISAIPEPSSLLLITTLTTFLVLRRRKNNR